MESVKACAAAEEHGEASTLTRSRGTARGKRMRKELAMGFGKTSRVSSFWFVILCGAVGVAVFAARAEAGRGKPDDWFVKSEKPKQRRPTKFIASGETRDIIPDAPGAPLSQTERKQPPSPQYLIAKARWGASAVLKKDIVEDWNLAPNEVKNLIEMGRENGFGYHWAEIKFDAFSYNPKRMPAVFISGVRPVRFDPAKIDRLRQYVLDGGMIICDSVYGSPWFYESALEVFDEMFPESKFRVLPSDHPLYHTVADIEEVEYHCGRDDKEPFLEGLYIGSRIGVLVSRYGLGCGWQGNMDVFKVLLERDLSAKAYSPESARQIAANLVPYILGYNRVGEVEGKPEMFGLKDQQRPTAEFVFAQVQHEGAWNTHPGAARSLLTSLEKQTSIPVNLKRVSVKIGQDDLSPYPFLYFTGLDDFRLSDQEIEGLRTYVEQGGTLVVNNALGLARFHQAGVRELSRVFPGREFGVLPVSHEIYGILHDVREVEYTATLQKDKGEELQNRPVLYGMKFDGKLRVIYSPYDMEAGWNEIRYPVSRGYQSRSAQKLGMNVIMYCMTH